MDVKPRIVKRIPKGQTSYSWRICPYSTCDLTNVIPEAEKSVHYTTSGKMSMDVSAGHGGVGFICLDPNCSFYTGTAKTEIPYESRSTVIDPITGEYRVIIKSFPHPVCSGTYYREL